MRRTVLRGDAIRMISRVREVVCESTVLQEILDDYGAVTIFDALREEYAAVSNGFLSQVCEAISGETMEVIGEPEDRFRCPCCQRKTLGERYDAAIGAGYEVCGYCGWEDDGTRDEREHSGVNRGSMVEYRERLGKESNYYACEKWRV
jgi:hypothetical protein